MIERGVHGVYPGLIKSVHAPIMATGAVHAVHTDDVDPELLQKWKITSAFSNISQGVDKGGGLKEWVVGINSVLDWMPERMVSRNPQKSGTGVPCG